MSSSLALRKTFEKMKVFAFLLAFLLIVAVVFGGEGECHADLLTTIDPNTDGDSASDSVSFSKI